MTLASSTCSRSIRPASVFAPEMGIRGSRARREDRAGSVHGCVPTAMPEPVHKLIERLAPEASADRHLPRRARRGSPSPRSSCSWRVRVLKRWENGAKQEPREEWLISEWPEGHARSQLTTGSQTCPPTPNPNSSHGSRECAGTSSLNYKQLKGELGLDHDQGRSWLGWYHHTALVTAAHGFLTLERLHPKAQRPA